MPWGAIAGGLLGAAGAIGGAALSGHKSGSQQKRAIAAQERFAQKGVQWKAQDAREAGLHPLYALGAPTHSFTPVSAGDSWGPGMAQAGQDLGRAAQAYLTKEQRDDTQSQLAKLAIENAKLNNAFIAEQITASQSSRFRQWAGASAPFPSGPSQNSPIQDIPLERVIEGQPGREPGPVTGHGYIRNPDSSLSPVKSADAAERLEDDVIGNLAHGVRRYVSPWFGQGKPPLSELPSGASDWVWRGDAWYPVRTRRMSPAARRRARIGDR